MYFFEKNIFKNIYNVYRDIFTEAKKDVLLFWKKKVLVKRIHIY